jgi:sterol desaturase/sphingolipid hydroxylase (fatty acid hydroxylase superfamily)
VLFHPIEMALQVLLQMFVTVVVLGLDPLAAALTGYVAAFHALFQHWNVRTPQWLGWFIQRPEAHCEHHRRGVHAGNYGDLPLWDILLGTFRNPKAFDGDCGFDAPADRRLGAILVLRDVNARVYGAAIRGVAPQDG